MRVPLERNPCETEGNYCIHFLFLGQCSVERGCAFSDFAAHPFTRYQESFFITLGQRSFQFKMNYVNAQCHAKSHRCSMDVSCSTSAALKLEEMQASSKERAARVDWKSGLAAGAAWSKQAFVTASCQSVAWADHSPDDNSFSWDGFLPLCHSQATVPWKQWHSSRKGTEEALIVKIGSEKTPMTSIIESHTSKLLLVSETVCSNQNVSPEMTKFWVKSGLYLRTHSFHNCCRVKHALQASTFSHWS